VAPRPGSRAGAPTSSRAPGRIHARREPAASPALGAAPLVRRGSRRHASVAPSHRAQSPSPRGRLIAILVAVGLVYAILGARLIDVQVRDRSYYEQLGLEQRVHTVALPAARGSIFDRNGNDLAVSVSRSSIWADPRVITAPDVYAAKLAPILGVDAVKLADDLGQKDRAFTYVARTVEPDVATKVRSLDLAGIGFVPETKRYYPAGSMAAPLLGLVGTDNYGLAGLEAGQEARLAGKAGRMQVERDPQGRELPDGERRVSEPRAGDDLLLTIDQSLQYEAERVLAEEVETAKAKGGTVVLADVRTGDVLAMASVDGATTGVPARPATAGTPNRPLTDVFEPGSTNKVVTIAAAMEAGLVNPGTTLDVPGQLIVDGQEFKDVHSHGAQLSVADIVRLSSNVGTIQIARMLGKTRFDAALRAFGFGEPTGLAFPGEASGILLPLTEYNATSLASMPIGSGIAVTAMQMLDVYLTIANGGVSRSPRLVAATIDKDGQRHEAPLGASHRVVSEQTAASMRTMLEAVVSDGTGTKARVAGYRVAGKTGTARKPPYLKPPYKYVASFAGFAPADSPRLAEIVVLDEPQVNATGGEIAAPTFSRIMQYALAVDRVPAGG